MGLLCEDVGVGAEPLPLTPQLRRGKLLVSALPREQKEGGRGCVGVLRRHPGPRSMYLTPSALGSDSQIIPSVRAPEVPLGLRQA